MTTLKSSVETLREPPAATHRYWRADAPLRGATRSGAEARALLCAASEAPAVDLFPRLDGPGSSQDLPQFAAMATTLPTGAIDLDDPAWAWSRGCLRTPGLCVDGPPIRYRALPAEDPEAVEYWAPDFHETPLSVRGIVPGVKPYFVCNILAQFGLYGVRIEAERMPAVYRGTGLGGSNLAHAAAMILGSALSGVDLDLGQVYIAATQLENYFSVERTADGGLSCGVSLTGGQETLTAIQGGVFDNVHVGTYWGPYSVVSRELVSPERYGEIANHLALVNVGQRRGEGVTSLGINNQWMGAWSEPDGAARHRRKPELAYRAAEALRSGAWDAFAEGVREYRSLRAEIAPDYLRGQEELVDLCSATGTEFFPLGGGLGSCLVTGPSPARVAEVVEAVAATRDPERGRTTLPVQVRADGLTCHGFAALGLSTPKAPPSA